MDKKFLKLALIILSIVMLASCSTLSDESVEMEEASGYTPRDAIIFLGADMLDEVIFDLDPALLSEALMPSYIHYIDYVPLYEEYKTGYLSELSNISEELIKESYTELDLDILSLSANPERYISEAIMLADDLYEKSGGKVQEMLMSALQASPKVAEAFSASKKEFSAIKAVYENLSIIGLAYDMPEAEMADLAIVARIATEKYFESLALVENSLKNRIYDDSSAYSYFWEGRK